MEGKDGCFGEYMTLKNHLLHEIPQNLSWEKALLTEPLAAALEIIKQVSIDPDTSVALIGDGRLAYQIASVLRLHGVKLTVIGKHMEKLAQFSEFGVVTVENELRKRPEEDRTFELVVEATGSPGGMELASQIVRRQGTIVVKSTYAGTISLDMSYFVVNEITIKGSRCGPFEPALRLLDQGLVCLPPVEFYDLEEFEAAFSSRAFKAGFRIGMP